MRLKSFYAKTMSEALHMVKETLGDEAIIVATREEKGGKAVRVTAAIEQYDSYEPYPSGFMQGDQNNKARSGQSQSETDNIGFKPDNRESDALFFDDDIADDESAVMEKLTDVMLRHAVPEDIIDQVISCATVVGLGNPAAALIAALEHLYSFRPVAAKPSGKAVMLVGAPGAGKTLTVAKLAARAVMDDQKVAVISCDTVRAGGIEQLSAFTKLMQIDLQKAATPKQLAAALEKARGADYIFIDTPGTNPFKPEEMRDIAKLLAAGDIEPVLALPAGTDAEECGEIGRAFAALGVKSMIATRLDIARRMGGVLAAAHYGGLFFAQASNTPKVAEGFFALSPQKLAHLLMPELARKAEVKDTNKTNKQTVLAG